MNISRTICFAALVVAVVCRPTFAQAPANSGAVIRTETKLVLVDSVVTDKKGNYIRDLQAKDFRVYEDNKEQEIKSFSFESGSAAPSNPRKHYLVIFFDNSSMDYGDQARARVAAAKFIDSNGGPGRLMSIVNFGGSLQIAQNFTENTQRLKDVVNGVKFSAVNPNASDADVPQLGAMTAGFGARDVLYALKDLAKGLTGVPGRKTLILITGGFPLTSEVISEATAVISACNKANVAIYAIDVHGLVAPNGQAQSGPHDGQPRFVLASYAPAGMAFFIPQHGGTSAGGGGGHAGGSPGGGVGGAPGGGGRGGSTGSGGGIGSPGRGAGGGSAGGLNPYGNNSPWNNPSAQSRMIIPQMPDGPVGNQNIMFMLAQGTGGFVIHDTNDLIGGMEKIGKEQDEYYLLGYTPPDSEEGSCHTLRVKVDRGGTEVRFRTGYCNAKPQDLLAGNSTEKGLEALAASAQTGNLPASLQAPYFYTAPNVARVNVAMEITTDKVKFEKQKGKFYASINVLGLANLPDGSAGARFSDTIRLEFADKKEMEAFKQRPMHYENQFDAAAGKYNLKVVFASGGEAFGKVNLPLAIDPYDSKQFSMGALALSKEVHRASDLGTGLDALLLEDRIPLIANGMQLVPYGANEFKKGDLIAFYTEVYEPLLVTTDPKSAPVVAFEIRILDGKTGAQKDDTGLMRVPLPGQLGTPRIPLASKIPTDMLAPGAYKVEVKAVDDRGKEYKRTTDIQID